MKYNTIFTDAFQSSSFKICVGYDTDFLRFSLPELVYIDPLAPPHLGVVGASGSGKTYLLKWILGELSLHKEVTLIIGDYKGIDFRWLQGCPNFHQYLDASAAVEKAYSILEERIIHNPFSLNYSPVCCLIDEWASGISMLEKKKSDELKTKMAMLLMLGRGVSIFIILGLQRLDAENFPKGARDNIGNIVLLGSPSIESKRMIAPSYAEKMVPQSRGKGYLFTDGKEPRKLTVPTCKHPQEIQERIRKALERNAD